MHVAQVGFEVALSEHMRVKRVQLDSAGLASQRDPFERDGKGCGFKLTWRQCSPDQDLWEMPSSGGQQWTGAALASMGGSLLHTCSRAGWASMVTSLPVFPR